MSSKPYSQACENNKAPIFDVIRRYMTEPGTVLEIGSGTGQHAVHMAKGLPHVIWQPTDMAAHLPGIEAWRLDSGLGNVLPAMAFDVWDAPCSLSPADYLFSANTLHIMSWDTVVRFFEVIPSLLKKGGMAFFYGPFNYDGCFTSESNANFDRWLKGQSPLQGIRDMEDITHLAEKAGLKLVEDCEMPSNNRTLVWRRMH